jgi:hypothetical protein
VQKRRVRWKIQRRTRRKIRREKREVEAKNLRRTKWVVS